MLYRIRGLRQDYPSQFWLMLFGLLISTVGGSMIWPFLMVYVSEQLVLPMSTVASLMTVQALAGLAFSFVAGPVTDRFGRKWVMIISLFGNGIAYLFMSQAHTLPMFALLMGLGGAFNPLYQVGADAMMADLIPPEKRSDAYSLLRVSNNAGVAIGPAIGGFIASTSYNLSFIIAATGMITYSLLLIFRSKETLPQRAASIGQPRKQLGGYSHILRDGHFMSFTFFVALVGVAVTMLWVLLAVYAKQNFQVPESQYGFIPMTNAVMVVVLQFYITRKLKIYSPLKVMTIGAFLYAFGVGSVALGQGFFGFLVSMVIITMGEIVLKPTATTYTANLAPEDMRGRYMSILGLTWVAAKGVGPVMGGILNDTLGPVFIWYGGGVIGLLGALGLLFMATRRSIKAAEQAI